MTWLEVALIAAFVVAAIVLVLRFERLCLGDLAEAPDHELRFFTREGWSALIVFCIPVGGLLYLAV